MGFLDRAKQMAEQAQSKLDEAQKKFNEQRSGEDAPADGPVTAYDQHGRPVPAPDTAKKQGDPIVPAETRPAPEAPIPEQAPGDKLHGDPADALPDPPKVTPGDPLGG